MLKRFAIVNSLNLFYIYVNCLDYAFISVFSATTGEKWNNDNTLTLNVTLETNHFALFVWLEAITFTVTFSENGFIMTNTTWEVT